MSLFGTRVDGSSGIVAHEYNIEWQRGQQGHKARKIAMGCFATAETIICFGNHHYTVIVVLWLAATVDSITRVFGNDRHG